MKVRRCNVVAGSVSAAAQSDDVVHQSANVETKSFMRVEKSDNVVAKS